VDGTQFLVKQAPVRLSKCDNQRPKWIAIVGPVHPKGVSSLRADTEGDGEDKDGHGKKDAWERIQGR